MSGAACRFEHDVLALVAIDQWPRQADDSLVTHVTGCPVCADVVLVAAALRPEGDDSGALPDASAVWQHAQLQARQQAVERATRPVLLAQIVAAGVIAVSIALGVAWLVTRLSDGGGSDVFARAGALVGALRATAGNALATVGAGAPAGLLSFAGVALGASASVVIVALGVSALADVASDTRGRR